jgi:hypothetical protein
VTVVLTELLARGFGAGADAALTAGVAVGAALAEADAAPVATTGNAAQPDRASKVKPSRLVPGPRPIEKSKRVSFMMRR